MHFRTIPLLLLPAAALPAQQSEPPLAAAVVRQVDAVLQGDADPRLDHDRIWRACCTEHGEVGPLLAYLKRLAGQRPEGPARHQVLRLRGRIHRRAGQAAAALRAIETIPEAARSLADHLARAELLDALGRSEDALALYDRLHPQLEDPAAKKLVLLRRALMGTGVAGLAAFAKNGENSEELRNEAAVILALRGDQKTAIETFSATGEGTSRFRQEIRRAEWAMDAKLFDAAQAAAWEAVAQARLGRDRKYALSVLASAYRRDGAVDELLSRLEQSEALSKPARELWIRLLREEGRSADALRLFNEGDQTQFDAAMRRQLLEICRETGQPEVLVRAFGQLIAQEPQNLEWRSGLSRYYLEQGERQRATAVWDDLAKARQNPAQLLQAAFSLETIGLDEVAARLARQAAEDPAFRSRGLMFVFQMHLGKGQQEQAMAVLAELDVPDAESSVRTAIADGYERLGRPDLAVRVLEQLRASLGGYLGSDLEMKLAILLSRINRDDDALAVWRSLWSRLRTTPRGRFVEDRMMTVAARTGRLAKIAIELEDRLSKGEVDTEGIELLVRLYIKVGDPASATEVVEEFMKQAGSAELEVLKRKAKIYLTCQDYHHYEKVIHQLVEKDVENRLDHLRELAMSQLERGRRDLTVALLPRIREVSGDDVQMADEFEAGVYGLCGMREEALEAYVKGMGRHPGRIDTYLLISNLMRETGKEMEAARMFQYLAQTADRDDLFTIAIDGILNLRAQRGSRVPQSVVRWALRTTLERLATRPDKFYLYRLVTDLAVELNDMQLAIRTLKSGLPVAGERRTPIMREVMAKAQAADPRFRHPIGGRNVFKPSPNWDATDYVMVGRRLLGQGDHVPPQTFMNLATVFLREGDVQAAMRTFNRAAEVLDYAEVLREAAVVLENADRPKQALQYYQRLLAAGADDLSLLMKIGSLEEQLGNLSRAFEFYHRGLAQILAREPRYLSHGGEEARGPVRRFGGNVSIEDQLLPKFIDGMVLTAAEADVQRVVEDLQQAMAADLETVPEDPAGSADQHALHNYPRLHARAEVWRRLVLSHGRLDAAQAFDARLLARFAKDEEAAVEILRSRAGRGLQDPARKLLAASPLREQPRVRLAAGVVDASANSLSIAAAARLVVPNLRGDPALLRDVMERVDTGRMGDTDRDQLGSLLAACVLIGARNPAERFARAGLRTAKVAGQDLMLFRTTINLAARLSPELARSLLRQKIADVAEKQPTSMVSFVMTFTEVDAALGGGSLTSDAAKALILSLARSSDRSRPYIYFSSLLGHVDAEQRPSLVRELHRIVSATQRPRLLLDSISFLGGKQPDASFAEWFGRSLKVALETGGNNVVNSTFLNYNGRAPGLDTSPELALVALEVLEDFQPNPRNSMARVAVLLDLGKVDEAFAYAESSIEGMLNEPTLGRYAFQQTIRQLSAAGHKQRLGALVEKLGKKYAGNDMVQQARWTALSSGDPAEYRRQLEAELARKPKDPSLLSRLRFLERSEGRLLAQLEVMQRMAAAQPGNASHERSLRSLRRSLQHPAYVQAEAAKKPAKKSEAGRPGAPVRAGSPALRATSVARLVSGALVRSISTGNVRMTPQAQSILDLYKAGKKEEARRALRRYWRNFDAPNQYIQFPDNLRPGMFLPFEGKLPFLVDEVRALLKVIAGRGQSQVMVGRGLPQARAELYDILARDLKKQGRAAEVLAAKTQAVQAGTASSDDVEILLRLIELQEDEKFDKGLVEALTQRSELLDAERLKRLARLCARAGQTERAAQLYRLAVLSTYSGSATLRAERAKIERDFGDAAKGLILALIDDLSVNTQRYEMLNWANTAVELWASLLDAEEASRRMLAMKERMLKLAAATPYLGTKTPRGDLVALTLARAGNYDAALEELASWLRSEPASAGPTYNRVNIQPVAAMRRVTSTDGDFADRAAWLGKLAETCLAWHAEERLRDPQQLLAELAKALAKAEAQELAERCVAAIGKSEGIVERRAQAEALHAIDRHAAAFAIEEDLLAKGDLALARIVPTLDHIKERDGLRAARQLGVKVAEYCWNPELLGRLATWAEAAGDQEAAATWRERQATAYKVFPKPKKPAGARPDAQAPKPARRR